VLSNELVELVSLHLKAPLNEKYAAVCGGPVDLAAVYESIELLIHGDVPHEFRIEYDDGLLSERDVLVLARTVAGARRLVISGTGRDRDSLHDLAHRAGRHVQLCVIEGAATPERETLV